MPSRLVSWSRATDDTPGGSARVASVTPDLHRDITKGWMSMIRVLCVEDNPLVRAYLEQRLAIEPDIHVVSTVSHARGALTYLRQEEVDIVLLDYQLDHEDGM